MATDRNRQAMRRILLPLLLTLAGAALLYGGGLRAGPYWQVVALTLAMWIALIQSWSIFSGLTGYVSLGHAVAYGLGAYLMATQFRDYPVWVLIPAGGALAGLFALIVAIPVLRIRGPYFVILTFGLAELVKFALLRLETALGASSRLLFGAPGTTTLLAWMVALAAAATLLRHFVGLSRFGRGLIAIREDETAAETLGVPVTRFKVLAFALSAVIPGMVGAVMALRSTYFEVLQVFSPTISFTIVTMAIIGGSGDARGPVLGALFLVGLSELLRGASPQLYLILLGLCLIAFVLFAPNGLSGLLDRRRK
ncbi:MAG: branched-chain amino acid ABC transporter permease [Rhodobacter sp.]|nr:branched-chain amino acid ABC transporter permease [Paracoccaceae bacterium]MCC0076255.1 branched-chain amino acid ABC transporter permease [Rhodobacter sp.]